jgi:uncharacterized membrane protein HdeD (DUF308 family)
MQGSFRVIGTVLCILGLVAMHNVSSQQSIALLRTGTLLIVLGVLFTIVAYIKPCAPEKSRDGKGKHHS